MKACLTNVRLDTVSLIGKTLRQWRRFHDTSIKSLLLKRLQCLRTLAITLGSLSTTKLPSSHPILTSFTEAIKTLTQTWNANIQTSNLKKFRLSNKSMNFTLLWYIYYLWYGVDVLRCFSTCFIRCKCQKAVTDCDDTVIYYFKVRSGSWY